MHPIAVRPLVEPRLAGRAPIPEDRRQAEARPARRFLCWAAATGSKSTVLSPLSDKAGGRIAVVMQPLREDDLAGPFHRFAFAAGAIGGLVLIDPAARMAQ